MKRVKLVVAYDGTNYCGWQLQPNGVTIEEVLNRALSELLKAVSYTHLDVYKRQGLLPVPVFADDKCVLVNLFHREPVVHTSFSSSIFLSRQGNSPRLLSRIPFKNAMVMP